MSQEYNQWYWKLYRWCKWGLPYQHKHFIQGIKNLWRWFWVIWKDRDWDHHYYWEVTKKKITQMRDLHIKNMRFVNTSREIEKMNVVLKLIDRVQNDYYREEFYDDEYYQTKMKVEDGKVEFEDIKNELNRYIEKYPSAHKQVLNNPKYKKYANDTESDFKTSMLISIERHNKAKRILFQMLENNIESWWD